MLLAGCHAALTQKHASIPWMDTTWVRQYGGALTAEGDLILTRDGGYLHTRATQIFDVGPQGVLVTKLDPAGEREWQRVYGGDQKDEVHAILQTPDDHYVFIGATRSFKAQESDGWVVKVDQEGYILWEFRYGGIGNDVLRDGVVAADGGLLLVGYSQSQGFGEAFDAWVLKLDAQGGVIFQKLYGDWQQERALAVTRSVDTGYVIAGESATLADPPHDLDGWVFKIDHGGYIEWEVTLGGTAPDSFQAIASSGRRVYALAGYTQSFGVLGKDIWIVEIDRHGQVNWQRVYGSLQEEQAFGVVATTTAGYVLVGERRYKDHAEAVAIKLQSRGRIAWQKQFKGEGNARLSSAEEDAERFLVLGGSGATQMVKLNPYGFLNADCAACRDGDLDIGYPTAVSVLSRSKVKEAQTKRFSTASKFEKVRTWTGALCPPTAKEL